MNLRCLFLVKIVAIYALLVCKTFGLKIRSRKFFDKSHVCLSSARLTSSKRSSTTWWSSSSSIRCQTLQVHQIPPDEKLGSRFFGGNAPDSGGEPLSLVVGLLTTCTRECAAVKTGRRWKSYWWYRNTRKNTNTRKNRNTKTRN